MMQGDAKIHGNEKSLHDECNNADDQQLHWKRPKIDKIDKEVRIN